MFFNLVESKLNQCGLEQKHVSDDVQYESWEAKAAAKLVWVA